MVRRMPDVLTQLRDWFGTLDSALVAYSGGVDSALVMTAAHDQLGDRALACVGVSPSYPVREMHAAVELANRLAVPYRLVHTREHLDDNYAANPDNRCYFCKNELYGRLRRIADDEGWSAVLDGTNASDLGDDRPGMIAAGEQGVRSPLVELGITKDQVRELAHAMGLAVWDKPAMACLSSRVPHGTAITPALLRQIELAEDALVALGFAQFRVRHHDELARIELLPQDIERAITVRDVIVAEVTAAGYTHVCLDLVGYGERGADAHTGCAADADSVMLTVEGRA